MMIVPVGELVHSHTVEGFDVFFALQQAGVRADWASEPHTGKAFIGLTVPTAILSAPDVSAAMEQVVISGPALEGMSTQVVESEHRIGDVGRGFYMGEGAVFYDLSLAQVVNIAVQQGAPCVHINPVTVILKIPDIS